MKKEKKYRKLEIVAQESKDILVKQIESYRTHHAKAGSIIGIVTLFFPIFLFIIENSSLIVKRLSIVPLIFFVWSIILMLQILRSRKLDNGVNPEKYDDLVNNSYQEVLVFIIGANRESFLDNERTTETQNRRFNNGLIVLLIGIAISIVLLFLNLYLPK